MAAKRSMPVNQNSRAGSAARVSSDSYIHGNTVRKAQPVRRSGEPKREPARHTPDKVRHNTVDHTARRNRDKALNMDLPYVIALTIAAICSLYICVNYLHMQSSITGRIHKIESLEQELEKMKIENDALSSQINTYLDLDYVYEVATKELGMVYANKDQVILYDRAESEYVRQYDDIPKHK